MKGYFSLSCAVFFISDVLNVLLDCFDVHYLVKSMGIYFKKQKLRNIFTYAHANA